MVKAAHRNPGITRSAEDGATIAAFGLCQMWGENATDSWPYLCVVYMSQSSHAWYVCLHSTSLSEYIVVMPENGWKTTFFLGMPIPRCYVTLRECNLQFEGMNKNWMWPGELRINATIVLHWIPFQIGFGSVHPLCCPMLQVAPAQGWIHVVSQASLLFRSFVQGSSFLNQKCFKFSEWLKRYHQQKCWVGNIKKMVFNYPDKNRQICKPHNSMYPRHDTTRAVVSRSTRGGGIYSLWVEGPGFEHRQGEMVLESTYIYII